jgi:WS/DGAT/MGAT family acyltransferase
MPDMTERHTRLSGMDSSFLTVENDNAHMHVGWASLFSWPRSGRAPGFEALREHIAGRLARAPRCRQRLASVPLGLDAPVWVDDPDFDIRRHVRRLPGRDFRRAADEAFSRPLDRARPLWELWIADELARGRLGVVAKAHHAMVDGIAAVELAALLVDTEADAPAPETPEWSPRPAPSAVELLADSAGHQVSQALGAARAGLRAGRGLLGLTLAPGRLGQVAGSSAASARALGHALAPAQKIAALDGPASPHRSLSGARRSLEEIATVRLAFGGTMNDVVLAAVAGGLRRFAGRHGDQDIQPKAMVPVNVRGDGDPTDLGNRISFMFLELPCDVPEPLGRLEAVKQATRARKRAAEPQTGSAVLGALELTPRPVQAIAARLLAAPRSFNLVVSNIPGPPEPLYMLGCPLEEVYPVVPLAEGHPVSVGFSTVQGEGFFGVYADSGALPEAERLARDIGASLDELVALARRLSDDSARRPAGRFDRANGDHREDVLDAELDAAAAGLAPTKQRHMVGAPD